MPCDFHSILPSIPPFASTFIYSYSRNPTSIRSPPSSRTLLPELSDSSRSTLCIVYGQMQLISRSVSKFTFSLLEPYSRSRKRFESHL